MVFFFFFSSIFSLLHIHKSTHTCLFMHMYLHFHTQLLHNTPDIYITHVSQKRVHTHAFMYMYTAHPSKYITLLLTQVIFFESLAFVGHYVTGTARASNVTGNTSPDDLVKYNDAAGTVHVHVRISVKPNFF